MKRRKIGTTKTTKMRIGTNDNPSARQSMFPDHSQPAPFILNGAGFCKANSYPYLPFVGI